MGSMCEGQDYTLPGLRFSKNPGCAVLVPPRGRILNVSVEAYLRRLVAGAGNVPTVLLIPFRRELIHAAAQVRRE